MPKRSVNQEAAVIDNTTRGDTVVFPILRRAAQFVVGVVTTAVVAVVRVVQKIFMSDAEYKDMMREAKKQKEIDERTDEAVKNARAMTKELRAMLVNERQRTKTPDRDEPVDKYTVRACEPVTDNKAYKINVELKDGSKLSLFASKDLKVFPEALCPTEVMKATQKRLDKMSPRFAEKTPEPEKEQRADKEQKAAEQRKEQKREAEKTAPERSRDQADKPKLKIAELEQGLNAAKDKEAGTKQLVESYAVKMAKGKYVIDVRLPNGKTIEYKIEDGLKLHTDKIEPAGVRALAEKHLAEIVRDLSDKRTMPEYLTVKNEEKEKEADKEEEREERKEAEEEKKEEKTEETPSPEDKIASMGDVALFALYVSEVLNGPSCPESPKLTWEETVAIDTRVSSIVHETDKVKNVILDIEDRKIAVLYGGRPGRMMQAANDLISGNPELNEKLATDDVARTVSRAIEDGVLAAGMCAVCGGVSFSLQQMSLGQPDMILSMLAAGCETKEIVLKPGDKDIANTIEDGLQGLFFPEIDDRVPAQEFDFEQIIDMVSRDKPVKEDPGDTDPGDDPMGR